MPDAAPTPTFTPDTDTIPAAACQLALGTFQLAAADVVEEGKPVPITMLARTGQPIQHWYWGKTVHDLSGMKLHKKTLPIDYCHLASEVLGYLDEFETETGDLVAKGALVPFRSDDRAAEVAHKAKAKVPYEASIDFAGDGLVVEYVSEGATVEVNGYQIEGPATVFRQWPLRGVAVCPHGADMNTSSSFAASEKVGVRVLTSSKETKQMAKTETTKQPAAAKGKKLNQDAPGEGAAEQPAATTPDNQAAAEAPVEAAEGATEQPTQQSADKAPGQRFIDAFGEQKGSVYFTKGLTFDQAEASFREQLAAENAELRQKLASAPSDRGADPVEFQEAAEKKTKGLSSFVRIAGKR